jgi:hypothetical protein
LVVGQAVRGCPPRTEQRGSLDKTEHCGQRYGRDQVRIGEGLSHPRSKPDDTNNSLTFDLAVKVDATGRTAGQPV